MGHQGQKDKWHIHRMEMMSVLQFELLLTVCLMAMNTNIFNLSPSDSPPLFCWEVALYVHVKVKLKKQVLALTFSVTN